MESYLKSRKPIVLVQQETKNNVNTETTKSNSKPPSEPIIIGPLNTNVCNWDQILLSNKRKHN